MVAPFLIVVATVLAGLCAGLFYAFSTGVMPGLARTGDHAFVSGMRSINRAVLNPLFLGAIFLAPLAILGAGIAAFTEGSRLPAGLLLAALLISVGGVTLVTIRGNVPLNDALETSRGADPEARRAFEARWVRLNHVRTACATLALVLCAIAAVVV